MNGVATSPSADVLLCGRPVKEALDATMELSGDGYVFGAEGYETLLNTNMKLELDNLAMNGRGLRQEHRL